MEFGALSLPITELDIAVPLMQIRAASQYCEISGLGRKMSSVGRLETEMQMRQSPADEFALPALSVGVDSGERGQCMVPEAYVVVIAAGGEDTRLRVSVEGPDGGLVGIDYAGRPDQKWSGDLTALS